MIIMAGATHVQLPAQMERQYRYIASVSGADSAAVMAEWQKLAPGVDRVAEAHARGFRRHHADSRPRRHVAEVLARSRRARSRPSPCGRVTIPVLVLQGMRDYQVPPDQLDDWLKVLGPHKELTVKRYPALSHLMIAGSGPPRPAEYAVAGHVDTLVIADIATWFKGIAPRRLRLDGLLRPIEADLHLLEGDQPAADHRVELGENALDLLLGVDTLDRDRQVE